MDKIRAPEAISLPEAKFPLRHSDFPYGRKVARAWRKDLYQCFDLFFIPIIEADRSA